MTSDPAFRDLPQKQRFELDLAGGTVFADYERRQGFLVIRYVYAPPALRGTGAAGRLMTAIVELAKAEKLELIATCSYADVWLQRYRSQLRTQPAG